MILRAAVWVSMWILVSSPAWAGTSLEELKQALKPYEAANKSYALYKPADWTVQEQAGPDNLHVRVLAADSSAAVDFFYGIASWRAFGAPSRNFTATTPCWNRWPPLSPSTTNMPAATFRTA